MTRIGFELIGGRDWMGGYNYFVNLVSSVAANAANRITPVVFFGTDIAEDQRRAFEAIAGVTVVMSPVFNLGRKQGRLARALATGVDAEALPLFRQQAIDVIFENAQFHGWRFPIPAVAWIPDFQHRKMAHLFTAASYWKREIGFQAQVRGGSTIMLSSEDARADCERFYPSTRGRTHVVRFAVHAPVSDPALASAVATNYALPDQFLFLPNQFWAHKNHTVVIDALALCAAQRPDLVVAASGRQQDPRDPAHMPRLRERIAAAGLLDRFRLLGMIPGAHLPLLMRASGAVINPSTFEGWSTTVEEAKALGVPMLLSDIAVHREQADAQAAFFDPRSPQQLAALLRDFQPLDAEQKAEAAIVAARRANLAVRAFADDFADVVAAAARTRL